MSGIPLRTLVAVAVLACISAIHHVGANPLVITHPAHITSEELKVVLDADAAVIDGAFRFQSTAQKGSPGEEADVRLMIPIWIPRKATQGDASVASMLDTFAKSSLNYVEGPVREVWNSAIAFKFTIGGREIPITTFSVFDPTSKHDRERLPDEFMHGDFLVICAWVDFPPKLLRGSPEVRLQYRQPLLKTKSGAEFLYVPVFQDTPKGFSTSDLKQYAMVLQSKTSAVWLGDVKMSPGHSARLPLSHYQPIKVLVAAP